jgi:hypothetical protein
MLGCNSWAGPRALPRTDAQKSERMHDRLFQSSIIGEAHLELQVAVETTDSMTTNSTHSNMHTTTNSLRIVWNPTTQIDTSF